MRPTAKTDSSVTPPWPIASQRRSRLLLAATASPAPQPAAAPDPAGVESSSPILLSLAPPVLPTCACAGLLDAATVAALRGTPKPDAASPPTADRRPAPLALAVAVAVSCLRLAVTLAPVGELLKARSEDSCLRDRADLLSPRPANDPLLPLPIPSHSSPSLT
jgi:hypothetical protein